MRVGVPQALLYWTYAPLWLTVLRQLGAEPVVSGATTRATLDVGVKLAVDEVCLPVKVFYGHCAALVELGIDALFVPRLVAVEERAYICPKFMGLPDMVRHALGSRVRILAPVVDLRRKGSGYAEAVAELAGKLGRPARQAKQALGAGWAAQTEAEAAWERGSLPLSTLGGVPPLPTSSAEKRWIGVLGHPYNVYDVQISLDLLGRLARAGWGVATAETVPRAAWEEGARSLPKELFWTLGRRVYGAAAHLMVSPTVDGLIHLVSFGCGPDSLVGELVRREAERRGVPFLLLTLDEHTGEAGVWTRIEAFTDMLDRREAGAPRPS